MYEDDGNAAVPAQSSCSADTTISCLFSLQQTAKDIYDMEELPQRMKDGLKEACADLQQCSLAELMTDETITVLSETIPMR